MIKFSIITCTWNAAEVVERTLESVLSQSWAQIEHVIIDGASKDNTLQLVEAYRKRNAEEETEHDIVVVSEPDRGLYDAMNKGLKYANGDYVVFLNAGDVFPNENTLENISNDVNERSDGKLPGVLYGDTNIVDNEGTLLHPRRLAPPENLTWRSFKHGMLVCHQAFYARTDIAKAEPYNLRYRFSADYDWCIRIMRTAARRKLPMKNAGIIVADYLDGGMTTQNHRRSLMERFRVMAHHYGIITAAAMHLWFVARAVVKK